MERNFTRSSNGIDGSLVHLNHRDVTLLCFSRAPIERLTAYKQRMGWEFPYVSTYDTDFPFDFGLALTKDQAQQNPDVKGMLDNPPDWLQEWARQVGAELEDGMREGPGWIAFALEDGVVYHTYTVMAPDPFVAPYFSFLLERTPKAPPCGVTMTAGDRPATLVPVLTVALAAAGWLASLWQMRGMDMGAATSLGSPASFVAIWVPMMAAMMLPAAVPAVLGFVRTDSRFVAGLWFVASYLAVWQLFGIAAYGLYREHGQAWAGALTIVAGLYELTPFKRSCRERCRGLLRSGGRFGVYCTGSSAGLMLMLLALGVMNIGLMVGVTAIVLAQKLLPPRPFLDVTLALAIVAVGVLVVAGLHVGA